MNKDNDMSMEFEEESPGKTDQLTVNLGNLLGPNLSVEEAKSITNDIPERDSDRIMMA